MRIIMLLAFLFSCFTLPTSAEESAGKSEFRSFINGITCGQIVEGLDDERSRKAYVLMIGSFITGSNHAKKRDSQIELNNMLMITEQFCRQNPDKPVLAALVTLDTLIDKRIEKENIHNKGKGN